MLIQFVWDVWKLATCTCRYTSKYVTLAMGFVPNHSLSLCVDFVCCLQFILLGAVPFPSDVPRLKELGVCGVITLNEPYETLVPSSLYKVCFFFLSIYQCSVSVFFLFTNLVLFSYSCGSLIALTTWWLPRGTIVLHLPWKPYAKL